MLQLVGITRALNYLNERKCQYWTIYDSDSKGRNKIADNGTSADTTINDAERTLKSTLEDFQDQGGNVYLWVRNSVSDKAGGSYVWVAIPSIQPSHVASIGATVSHEDIAIQVQKGIESYKQELLRQKEIDDLKQQIKDLKNPDNQISGIERVFDRFEPYMPIVAGAVKKYLGIDIPISGVEKTETTTELRGVTQDMAQLQKDLENSLETLGSMYGDSLPIVLKTLVEWTKKDKEAGKLLVKLNNLCSEKPDMYNMAKNMI